jgi:hypothetical protein
MIRRNFQDPAQHQNWVLFAQREHAHFAANLAVPWRDTMADCMHPRQEILNAIAMHDDGWVDWDRHPQVRDDLPIAFDEIQLVDSLAIWRKSIDSGRQFGPVEGYAIACHFSRLLRAHDHWKQNEQDRALAESFLEWSADFQIACVKEWTELSSTNVAADCLRAAEFVRFFDELSIWILCGERTGPYRIATPSGLPITFTPQSTNLISVAPWPYELPEVNVSAVGRLVPKGKHPLGSDLTLAASGETTMAWKLVPGCTNRDHG